MNTSHNDSTLHFNKHRRTESGMPLLVDDFETNEEWWSQHEGVRPSGPTSLEPGSLRLAADLNAEAPAWCIEKFEEVREPDMFDEERAYWINDEGVVYVDIERINEVQDILANAERVKWSEDGLRFDRIHPSQYGIQVEWFNGAAHPAHESWMYASQAVTC
jgi:hypothetical protein